MVLRGLCLPQMLLPDAGLNAGDSQAAGPYVYSPSGHGPVRQNKRFLSGLDWNGWRWGVRLDMRTEMRDDGVD